MAATPDPPELSVAESATVTGVVLYQPAEHAAELQVLPVAGAVVSI